MKSVDPGILTQSVCFSFIPSNMAQELYFYPTWCGHYYCTHNYFMRRDTYPPLLIVFVREGVFNFEYRGNSFSAEKGDVVLMDCMEPHYYAAEDGLEFLYMHFNGSNSHEICQHILQEQGPLIQGENNVLIGRLLYDMVEFYCRNGIETMFQSSMRIYQLFQYLLAPASHQDENSPPIETVIHYIRSNIGKNISLEELADIANLSVYYFAHLFKHQTGFAPMEYVTNTRLERTKILLARTTKSVAEIAYEVGYSSSSSLINMFIKKVGISPTKYRRTHQSQETSF